MKKKAWNDVWVANFDLLKKIADGDVGCTLFVWPDEGSFDETDLSKWFFNSEHSKFEPLMIDRFSANVMMTVYNALGDRQRSDFRKRIEMCRGNFALVYEFSMARVKPVVGNA